MVRGVRRERRTDPVELADMSYDPKCKELAEYWLAYDYDQPELDNRAKELAQRIQDTIEEYLEDLKEKDQ